MRLGTDPSRLKTQNSSVSSLCAGPTFDLAGGLNSQANADDMAISKTRNADAHRAPTRGAHRRVSHVSAPRPRRPKPATQAPRRPSAGNTRPRQIHGASIDTTTRAARGNAQLSGVREASVRKHERTAPVAARPHFALCASRRAQPATTRTDPPTQPRIGAREHQSVGQR